MDTKPNVKEEESQEKPPKEPKKYFQCNKCQLREQYDYFGFEPPFLKKCKLLEEAYVIEDPFTAPKQNEILILGSHCIKCQKTVCKDTECSFYFNGTFCIPCAKLDSKTFPRSVQEKLNKIVS